MSMIPMVHGGPAAPLSRAPGPAAYALGTLPHPAEAAGPDSLWCQVSRRWMSTLESRVGRRAEGWDDRAA